MEQLKELRDYVLEIRKYFWAIVIFTLLLTAATGLTSFYLIPPTYEATTELLVNSANNTGSMNNQVSSSDIESDLMLIDTYRVIIKSPRIMDPVIKELGLAESIETLNKRVTIETVKNSKVVSIIVTQSDPQTAALIANTIANKFQTEIVKLMSVDNVNILASATGQAKPVQPKPVFNMLISFVFGLFISIGFIFLKEYFDTRVKTEQDIERYVKLPILGSISFIGSVKVGKSSTFPEELDGVQTNGGNHESINWKLIARWNPHSPITEAYRSIRTSIKFAMGGKDQGIILFTSPNPGEGKSVTSANLAVVYAQNQQNTLFVDADLRKPNIHYTFGISNQKGLTSYLAGDATFDEIVRESGIPHLFLVTSGPIPPNPVELLGSERMTQFLAEARSRFHTIVLDSPPMIVADPTVLSVKVDGCVLVTNATKTKREQVVKAVDVLDRGKAKILGTVLNQRKIKETHYYY